MYKIKLSTQLSCSVSASLSYSVNDVIQCGQKPIPSKKKQAGRCEAGRTVLRHSFGKIPHSALQ